MSSMAYLYNSNVQTSAVKAIDQDVPTSFFDLTMVFSGKLHYNIDEKDITLNKNDAILIPPGSMRIRYAGNEPVHYISINYRSDGTEEKDIPLYLPNRRTFFKEALLFFDKITKANIVAHREATYDRGLQLLIQLLKNDIENQSLNPHVQKILEYISTHLTRQITLNEIADSLFLTVPYCCHLVKKELGTTISEIIVRERVQLAQQYLSSGSTLLKDIPSLCGFTDYSTFYKGFKKHTGISPSKYKP